MGVDSRRAVRVEPRFDREKGRSRYRDETWGDVGWLLSRERRGSSSCAMIYQCASDDSRLTYVVCLVFRVRQDRETEMLHACKEN